MRIYSFIIIVLMLCTCAKNENENENGNAQVVASAPDRSGSFTFSNFRIVVYHHPDEVYFPMDPAKFIKQSHLLHQVSFGQDLAFNKKTLGWEKLQSRDSDFYNIPVKILSSYKLRSGKNCRPNDKNNSSYNVYLQTEGELVGEKNASGVVPCTTYKLNDGRKQYWLFYGFDYSKVCGLNFSHQGDWESVTLNI
jgi:hypothetical protein